jgi:hypothetical protein
MPRRALIVLLSFGVFAGYGSAFASARWHMRHHAECEHGRWNEHARWDDRFGDRFAEPRSVPAPTVAPQQPQTVVVQSPAPAAAPAPQIFVIMPGAASPVPAQLVQAPAPQAANP